MSKWFRDLYKKQVCTRCHKTFTEADSFGRFECTGGRIDHIGPEFSPVQLMTEQNEFELKMHRKIEKMNFAPGALNQFSMKPVELTKINSDEKILSYYIFVIRDPKYDKIEEFIQKIMEYELTIGTTLPEIKDC